MFSAIQPFQRSFRLFSNFCFIIPFLFFDWVGFAFVMQAEIFHAVWLVSLMLLECIIIQHCKAIGSSIGFAWSKYSHAWSHTCWFRHLGKDRQFCRNILGMQLYQRCNCTLDQSLKWCEPWSSLPLPPQSYCEKISRMVLGRKLRQNPQGASSSGLYCRTIQLA